MGDRDANSTVRERLSGLGLADALRLEKAEAKKQKRREKEARRACRQDARQGDAERGDGDRRGDLDTVASGPAGTSAADTVLAPEATVAVPLHPDRKMVSEVALPDLPAAAEGKDPEAGPLKQLPGESTAEMITRLYQAFSGQMDQLETRLAGLLPEAGGMADIDKTVKTLASLAKTLTVLMELRDANAAGVQSDTQADAQSAAQAGGEESECDDPDALRAELARRVLGLGGQGAG
ncbi:hypothetical protein E1180_09245 [Roseibium denhamense]|uniref:Uncharacterized protein n=1 Tax=Roseibium denhamense TaxID=76305 RepID=A0ABY1PLP0_9HYPH|nr:hypothetical protein [Roseibium denhamense]MTI05700.1 hypothetical protein [Roseibium denhamense]SMP36909.1 hypothetical protein SAMN06265374_4368 [Roseibium denhamense]